MCIHVCMWGTCVWRRKCTWAHCMWKAKVDAGNHLWVLFCIIPSAQNVATLARQLDLQSTCLCLTRLDFQVEPHFPGNLCGFWRPEFPPSSLYSKCFNDWATFLTFYRYFWSKVSSLHKGRTKKIWRMYVAMYTPIYMGLPSQESKLNKI